MPKRPYYVAFALVLLLTVTALNLPGPRAAQVKRAWGSPFRPLFGLVGSAEDFTRQVGRALLPRSFLVRRLEQLEQDNQGLRFQLTQLQVVGEENERLRHALGWQVHSPWRLRAVRVVGHDPSNWWRSLLIDAGSREGLRPDLTVLAPDGTLVGRVADVALARSQVLLAGDPNCRFSAVVQESRAKGIIAPNESSFDRLVVDFTFVPTSVSLRPGQAVVTSGDGGVFPKEITVGQIVDVQTNEFGLYLEARVRLAANLNRLEEVWVILP